MTESSKNSAIITGAATVFAALITVVGSALLLQPKPDANKPDNGRVSTPEPSRTTSPVATPTSDSSRNPRALLEASISQMITLLEAGRNREFLNVYSHPEELAQRLRTKKIEELERDFGEGGSKKLLAGLKQIDRTEPDFISERSASFKVDTSRIPGFDVDNEPFLYFKVLGGRWYWVEDRDIWWKIE